MTAAEAADVVGMLRSAWPLDARYLTKDAAVVYASQIAAADFSDAATAVNDLVPTSNRLPSVAELKSAIADAKRRREDRSATDLLALPDPQVARGEQYRRKARLQIANVRRWQEAVALHAEERERRRKGFPAPTPEESDAKLHRATVAMMREGTRIYTQERPFPSPQEASDAEERTERDIAAMRGRPGALVTELAATGSGDW